MPCTARSSAAGTPNWPAGSAAPARPCGPGSPVSTPPPAPTPHCRCAGRSPAVPAATRRTRRPGNDAATDQGCPGNSGPAHPTGGCAPWPRSAAPTGPWPSRPTPNPTPGKSTDTGTTRPPEHGSFPHPAQPPQAPSTTPAARTRCRAVTVARIPGEHRPRQGQLVLHRPTPNHPANPETEADHHCWPPPPPQPSPHWQGPHWQGPHRHGPHRQGPLERTGPRSPTPPPRPPPPHRPTPTRPPPGSRHPPPPPPGPR